MKQTIGLSQFTDEFNAIRPNNFSYEGLEQLFNYFESYEADTGEEIELDVIAICCEYQENTIEEIETAYGYNMDLEKPLTLEGALAYLSGQTSVIGHTETTIIFQDF